MHDPDPTPRPDTHPDAPPGAHPDARPDESTGAGWVDDAGVPPEMKLARRLAAALDVEHVSLVLFVGPRHRAVVRGSDPDLVVYGDMAATVGEGPVYDVLHTGRPCVVQDMTSCTDRWPVLLSTYPVPDHLRSLLIVPVTTAHDEHPGPLEDVLGVVVMSPGRGLDHDRDTDRDTDRNADEPFTTSDVTDAARGARAIATALLTRAGAHHGPALDDDLDNLIDPRADVVPMAVGALCELEGLHQAEAVHELRARAFLRGLTMQQVGHELLAGRP